MAFRHPALPIVNVLASALLAAVAMHAPVSPCDQRRHAALLHPIHDYFDRIEHRLSRDYPLLLQRSPSGLIGQGRIDCRCGESKRQAWAPASSSQLFEQMRDLLRLAS